MKKLPDGTRGPRDTERFVRVEVENAAPRLNYPLSVDNITLLLSET